MKKTKHKDDTTRIITLTEKHLKVGIAYSLKKGRVSVYDLSLSDVKKEMLTVYQKYEYSIVLRSEGKNMLLMCG